MPKVTSADGTIIAYDKKGDGPVVILVPGALNKRGSGKKLMEQLVDNFTVICYDRRGRGDSTEASAYSTEKEVEDLEALIDALGGEAFLYGHSSGAVLALLAAKQLKSKVRGLALYELPYDANPESQRHAKEYRDELRALLSKDERGEAVTLFVKSFGVTDKQIAAMKRLPMWKGLTGMAPTLAYDTIALMEQYPSIALSEIDTPTLVIYGEASPPFMADTAAELSQALPHATLRPLAAQTHDVKADVLAPVLIEFYST